MKDSGLWYARLDSNQRPSESESDALSNCATGAFTVCYYTISLEKKQPFFEISLLFLDVYVMIGLLNNRWRLFMANAEIFKTSFKGYNKEEVIAYIDNLNHRMEALQNELNDANARLLQADEERNDIAAEKERNQAEMEALRQEITDELMPALRASVAEEIRPEIEQEQRKKLEVELASKFEEAARAEINNRIQAQSGELQELRRRAQLYDDNREVLAELMIKAKNDAAGIIEDAEAHAKALRADAEQRYQRIMSDYEILKKNLICAKMEAADRLAIASRCLEDFEKKVSGMESDIQNSAAHLQD